MAGYTPVFDSVFKGSLYGKWPDTAAWICMLALADSRGQIDITPEAIAGMTGMPLKDLLGCIERFCAPDPRSRSQAEEGRKLLPIDPARDWGWRVVNIQLYRERARDQNRVADGTNAEKLRTWRDSKRNPVKPGETRAAPRDPNSDSYSDTDSNKKKNPDRAAEQPEPGEFVELRRDYPKRAGSQRWHDALGAYKARVREGADPQLILAGVRRYAAFIRATGKERSEHVQQAATFLGKNRGFELPWALPAKPETAGDRLLRNINGDESKVIDHEPELFPALARG